MERDSTQRYWDEAPVLFDVLTSDGTILYANATQARALGFEPGALTGQNADLIYPASSLKVLKGYFDKAQRGETVNAENLQLSMRTKSRERLELPVCLNISNDALHGAIMHLVKHQDVSTFDRLKRLESENEVLSSIIDTARDATYCVDFLEPVDLTAPEHEIVRQVFENACRWRYCNEAMGRFYRLPPGEDLNTHDVREVFPRNPDNEAFVRALNASGWHLNGAQSRDHRYDGSDIYTDNDVRAQIIDGRLFRFWGTLRDESTRLLKQRQLRIEAGQAIDLLGAVPDPILVINRDGRVEGANPAVEWSLGWPLDELLGSRLDTILKFDGNFRALLAQAGPGRQAVRRRATATCSDGSKLSCEVNVASIDSDDTSNRLVMTLRTSQVNRGPVVAAIRGRS